MRLKNVIPWLSNLLGPELIRRGAWGAWRNNAAALLERKLRPFALRPRALPQVMHIDVCSRCNLSCRHCVSLKMPGSLKRDMSLETFKNIAPIFPYVKEVSLFGCAGEPLLNPDFFEMVKIVKRYPPRLIFSSNGMLWNEAVIDQVFRSGIDALTFSVDGATPETVAAIRPPADLNHIVSVIRRIQEIKRSRGLKRPEVTVCFTLAQDNYREAPGLVELARGLGIERAWFLNMMPHNDAALKQSLLRGDGKLLREVCDGLMAQARAGRGGPDVHVPAETDLTKIFSRPVCRYPWEYLQVRNDGEIFPCCFFIFPTRLLQKIAGGKLADEPWDVNIPSMGNVNSENILSIWRGRSYADFRQTLRCGKGCNESCIFLYGFN